MRKIKIAIFSANAYPIFNPECPPVFGGAEVDQYNLALYLSQNPDIDLTFYVGDFSQTNKPEIIDGVRLQKIPLYGWHKKKSYQKVIYFSHLFKSLWQSDAEIMLTEMAGDMVGWGAIFFKILRKKYLIHRLASDRDTEYISPSSSGGWRTYLLYKLGLKKADFIFSQTQQQKCMLKERMGFNSVVVPNGFFINGKVDTGIKQYILWIGRCTPLKRPELFVNLARRIPEKKFVMIMPPPIAVEPDDFRENAAKLIEEASSLPNMTHIEHVPFNRIQQIYNRAQLFVNTSIYEGFPNTFIQSCLGGTPIASLQVDPDGFIERNRLGISCADNFEQLVEFIKNISEDQICLMGDNALKYARKHHDISIMGGEYEQACRQILNLNSTKGFVKMPGDSSEK